MSIAACLRSGALHELFVEHLGWDRVQGGYVVELGADRYELERVAQKRGFLVLRCTVDRSIGQTKKFVRGIQSRIERLAHEHILVIHDQRIDTQVWTWSYRDRSTGRQKHRFHPLFADRIPPRLVERIERLSIALDEEEQITLLDVAERTRDALDSDADLEVFFRRPGYARKSHKLALEMRAGGQREFDRFVIFHQRMAAWYTRRYKRIIHDEEDLVQEAMVGIVKSARSFDPERGAAFSTYAFHAMRNECHRALTRLVALGRVPEYLYWPFRRIMRTWERAVRSVGPEAAEQIRDEAIAKEGIRWSAFCCVHQFFYVESLDEAFGGLQRFLADYRRPLLDPGGRWASETPVEEALAEEQRAFVAEALSSLPAVDEQIIRARFGIGTEEATLEKLGAKFRLTRERIRQRESKALESLARWLKKHHLSDIKEYLQNALDAAPRDDGPQADDADCSNQP